MRKRNVNGFFFEKHLRKRNVNGMIYKKDLRKRNWYGNFLRTGVRVRIRRRNVCVWFFSKSLYNNQPSQTIIKRLTTSVTLKLLNKSQDIISKHQSGCYIADM